MEYFREARLQAITRESLFYKKAFDSSKKLTGWTGLRPRNDESAGKIKSKATTKGNKYLKRIMVQVAWAASQTRRLAAITSNLLNSPFVKAQKKH